LAFTTTVGAGGTSLIGTSGVDTTTFAPGTLATAVFIGAQGDNDFITLQANQANNYTIRGGAGVDTITAAGLSNSILTGDDGNDVITINTNSLQSATVSGLEGNDNIAIQSSVSGSIINGNNGNDTFAVGTTGGGIALTSSAKIVGGQGNDTFTIGAAGGNRVSLTSGLVNGQDGDDTITIANVASMTFGSGSTVFGGQGSDVITSTGSTNVIISGDLGTDNLTGGSGNDTIFGGDGNDRIAGGTGNDSMIGGAGVDTFIQPVVAAPNAVSTGASAVTAGTSINFGNGVDIITSFTAGTNGDILSMSGTGGSVFTAAQILSNTQATAGGTALTAGTVYAVSGNFANGVFTYAANNTGSDTLLMTALANAVFEANTNVLANGNQVVLAGVNVAQLLGANFA